MVRNGAAGLEPYRPGMVPIALAAAIFGSPLPDAELAAAAPFAGQVSTRPADLRPLGPPSLVIQEQVDAWWAEDGAAAIAEVIRPRPALTGGVDLSGVLDGRLAIHFERTVSARTTGF